MNFGDLVWVDFPARGGRAQMGRRPAIVAQTAEVSTWSPMVVLIPLTTQLDALRFPATVLVEPDESNRLPRPSVALVFQLAAIDARHLGSGLGVLGEADVERIRKALDELTGRG